MAIIIKKFGGTSVKDIDRIRKVALIIKKEFHKGNKIIVVVSAMAGVTDQLIKLVSSMTATQTKDQLAEYDSILSTGEQVSSGLLALALQELGINARSVMGWQLSFLTDDNYSKARIIDIDKTKILKSLEEGQVLIVAGFQGVDANNRVTTLGRGGSDTSAVAIAAAIKADRCDIYTDVEGIYTTDPRIAPKAQKLEKISYEEMLEMASLGAKVLQTRSVVMAMKYHVPLRVLSSFSNEEGTYVIDEEIDMEKKLITGIAYNASEARITLRKVPDKPGVSAAIFGPLAEALINVDMIIQNISECGQKVDITFTVERTDVNETISLLEAKKDQLMFESLTVDSNIAKVSIIGVGMRSHSGVAQIMFDSLASKGINIMVISTSEIKISVLISDEYLELAIRTLHTVFGLDKKEEINLEQ
ncbi:MAG: aspartate kinase [Alphaproteobacteria bacterium]